MNAYWIALACCLSLPALAETEHPLLASYAAQARQQDANFTGFSAEHGKALYFAAEQRNGKSMSCTTCHTSAPRQPGQTPPHRKAEPLAPAAHPTPPNDLPQVTKKYPRKN